MFKDPTLTRKRICLRISLLYWTRPPSSSPPWRTRPTRWPTHSRTVASAIPSCSRTVCPSHLPSRIRSATRQVDRAAYISLHSRRLRCQLLRRLSAAAASGCRPPLISAAVLLPPTTSTRAMSATAAWLAAAAGPTT